MFTALVDGDVAQISVDLQSSNESDLLSALDSPVCEVVREET